MHPFLSAFSDRVSELNVPPENQIVVLPSKRACSFFQSIHTRKAGSGKWLPETITLDALASRISEFEISDPIYNTFALYEAYQNTLGTDAVSLPEFMSWSDILLTDFNDIEAYQLNPEKVFKELVDYTEIEHFSFLNQPLTEKQERFRRFWRSLNRIFNEFQNNLKNQGLGTAGMVMRNAANLVDDFLKNNPETFITVGGFNALSNAELHLFKKIQDAGRGRIYYDLNSAFLDKKTNAGLFIRKNLEKGIGEILDYGIPVQEKKMEISVFGATNKLDQANAIAAILQKKGQNYDATCLALADESLLLPIIERLPREIEKVNVTMGVGLSNFSFFTWMEDWMELQMNFKSDGNLFPPERWNKFFLHPFSRLLDLTHPGEEGASDLSRLIAKRYAKPDLNNLEDYFEILHDAVSRKDQSNPEYRAAAVGLEKVIAATGFLKSFEKSNELNWQALSKIYRRTLSRSKLSLIGEPREGLQIMGVLETRALGFSDLIVCSVDETHFPAQSHIESFIPFEIRMYHGLPGKREKEAVFSSRFYQLLAQADRFNAIYHTDIGTFGGGEMSRYLRQIEDAAPQWKASFSKVFLTHGDASKFSAEHLIEKTPEVVQLIQKRILEKGLSASFINRFYESPLEWYYTHILGLDEPSNEEIDVAVFGEVVHLALQNLYHPLENSIIQTEDLKKLESETKATLVAAFEKVRPGVDLKYGKNRIHFETASKMILAYLSHQKSEVKKGSIKYVKAEEEIKEIRKIRLENDTLEVPVKGFIDRMEVRDGVLHLIDFKTGKVEAKDLKATIKKDDLKGAAGAERFIAELQSKGKLLQLFFYEWLMQNKTDLNLVESRIVSLITPKTYLPLKQPFPKEDALKIFEDFLSKTVQKMLDPETPLIKNPDFAYAVFE